MNVAFYNTLITNNKQDYQGIINFIMLEYKLPRTDIGHATAIELLARMYFEKHNA